MPRPIRPEWYEEEQKKLAEKFFGSDEFQDWDSFYEEYASDRFKAYDIEDMRKYKENLKKGIIVN